MRRFVILAVAVALLAVSVPASAADGPPPAPDGWTTTTSGTIVFPNQTNPCTGETGTTHFQTRVNHTLTHKDGGATLRRYVEEWTSDGWRSNGWVHSETPIRIFPDHGVFRTRELVIPLYEDGGNGVMFARHSLRLVMVGDQTLVIDSGFELRCARN